MRKEHFGRVCFVVLFSAFQVLLVLWLTGTDRSFIPSLSQGERLLELGDYHGAVSHLKPLAEAGSGRAAWLLGELYANGTGVQRDMGRGVRYLERAADANVVPAQFLLSRIYSDGDGIPKNLVRAHFWLSLAAVQNRPEGEVLLTLLERMMTPEQIEQAWAMAEQRAPGTRARLQAQ